MNEAQPAPRYIGEHGTPDDVSGLLGSGPTQGSQPEEGDEEEETRRLLPMNNVKDIMKLCLPRDAKINKEAILWLQEKAADFQAILTEAVLQDCEVKTEAGDEETCAKVKHLNSALRALGFPEYALAIEVEVPDDEVQDAEVRMVVE